MHIQLKENDIVFEALQPETKGTATICASCYIVPFRNDLKVFFKADSLGVIKTKNLQFESCSSRYCHLLCTLTQCIKMFVDLSVKGKFS